MGVRYALTPQLKKICPFQIQQMAVDVEYAAMVNDVFKTNVPGYLWKSFVVVPTNEVKYNIKVSQVLEGNPK